MANENMIKFLRGNVANLPETATAGALYFTKDEGVYLGLEDGSYHRYGDFITVADVSSLPATGAHKTCMYYCTSENILARYDAVKGWIQINKQPTAEEMKTLLGLGSLAYKSEVAEADLNTDLAAKINASTAANHTHDNKALLDTYTQTEADLADAVAKKHAHANADELAKIADGDKAKWDAVVADHLTAADKTTLEDSIKEAKKAGTDANTALEAYKVINDAAVKAVEDDIAEITDGTNGILAQAKSYADGKDGAIAEAKAAGTTAQSNLEAYQTSNNAALAGVKATAEAAATKVYTDEELAKKVDKVEGKSLISDSEIARLAGVTNYDDTALAGRVSTAEGKITDLKTASATHATKEEAQGYADAKDEAITAAQSAANKAQEEVDALETYVGTIPTDEKYADIDNVISYVNKKAEETLAAAQGGSSETAASVKQQLDNYKSENDTRVKAAEDAIDAIEADYLKAADKTELDGKITANANAIELLTNGVSAEEVDGVNDLIQYVKDHGAEVTGMKDDIAANAKAIEDHEALATETYETKEDASEKLAEAKEYADQAEADAISAAATDAQSKVDALANGQVKTNTDNIAKKANSADVYAKTETFTKDEVNAAIAAAVETAHTWGSF